MPDLDLCQWWSLVQPFYLFSSLVIGTNTILLHLLTAVQVAFLRLQWRVLMNVCDVRWTCGWGRPGKSPGLGRVAVLKATSSAVPRRVCGPYAVWPVSTGQGLVNASISSLFSRAEVS